MQAAGYHSCRQGIITHHAFASKRLPELGIIHIKFKTVPGVIREQGEYTAHAHIYQRREKAPVRKETEKQSEIKSDLFDYLRAVRLELAKQEKVPAYIILSNAALSDMAQKLPHTRRELLNVSGIGEVKAQRYGDVFLQAIQSWENNEHKS